jgi:hypothetical protein
VRGVQLHLVTLICCVKLLQYFGGGKTTLGKEFPGQVLSENVRVFFGTKLECEENEHLRAEWALLQGLGIKRVLIDVRTSGCG